MQKDKFLPFRTKERLFDSYKGSLTIPSKAGFANPAFGWGGRLMTSITKFGWGGRLSDATTKRERGERLMTSITKSKTQPAYETRGKLTKEAFYRFIGRVEDRYFIVQIKEDLKRKQKFLMSVFEYNKK